MAEKLEVVKARAKAKGRELQYGIRLHVIVRETEEEAWAAADKLIAHLMMTPSRRRSRSSRVWIPPARRA